MRYSLFPLSVLLLTIITPTLQAITIGVPGDQPTIQAGIDACVNGDTVLVANGTYTGDGNRDIDFNGKAIVVMSENGPDNCTINCQNSGRGFYFHNGEGAASILQGFTITNGSDSRSGGGIKCSSSSPTISNNIISGNSLWSSLGLSASGGGIYYGSSSSPTIINNVISNNEVSGESGNWDATYGYGGGIYGGSDGGIIRNNIISGNRVRPGASDLASFAYGGGIYLNSEVTITNCIFLDNSTYTDGSYGGGGVYSDGGDVTITNCIFWEDNSPNEIARSGGYLVARYSDIQGGYYGTGNIDSPPRFADADYHLQSNSPCVDAGDPSILDACPPPGWGAERSDMGAYGGEGSCGWLVDPIELILELTGSGLVYGGDTLFFSTLVQNNTGNPVAGDFWLDVMLPNGNEIEVPGGFLNYSNPLSGQVPADGSLNLSNELYIPMSAASGSHKLKGRVGMHPNAVIDEWWIDFFIAE